MPKTSDAQIYEGQIFSPLEVKRRFGALSFVHEARWKGQKLNLYSGYDRHFQYFFMEGPFAQRGATALVCSKIVTIEWQAMASGDDVMIPVALDDGGQHLGPDHDPILHGHGFYQKAVAVLDRASRLPAIQKMNWRDFSVGFYVLALGLVFLNFGHVDAHRFGTALAIGTTCWLGYRVTYLQR